MTIELPDGYALRPATTDDIAALFDVHRSAMRKSVERIWGWDESWQYQAFTENFDPPEQRQVICSGNVAVGFFKCTEDDSSIYIESIELDRHHQRRGIGTCLIQHWIDQSEASNRPLRLQVFQVNIGARQLYERLGFRTIGKTEHHFQMERHPPGAQATVD